jgi:hypothetical protein
MVCHRYPYEYEQIGKYGYTYQRFVVHYRNRLYLFQSKMCATIMRNFIAFLPIFCLGTSHVADMYPSRSTDLQSLKLAQNKIYQKIKNIVRRRL